MGPLVGQSFSFKAEPTPRMAELDRYARVCRVERVMRPYLEALSA